MTSKSSSRFLWITAFCIAVSGGYSVEKAPTLPEFGRDTVLVWEIELQNSTAGFVARLAEFYPDLLMEWEDSRFQGTVLMSNSDILEAKGYVTKKLFEPGVDTRSKDTTTLWLSRRIFRELKEKKKVKCAIDGVSGRMTYEGGGEILVEVNGAPMKLPVIVVRDDRGSERWFLDMEENPLMIKYTRRMYSQTLTSITTNRKNTLRWIKGQRLQRMLPD